MEAVSGGDGEGISDTLLWIVNNLTTADYGVVLLKMISLSAHFRMAGLCKVASAVIGILSAAVSELSIAVVIIVVIMAAVVDIVGEYQEFSGHADFVCDKDLVLSEKWLRLWLWYIVILAGLTGGVVCSVLLVLQGLIILLACEIGLVVVSIVKIIYISIGRPGSVRSGMKKRETIITIEKYVRLCGRSLVYFVYFP